VQYPLSARPVLYHSFFPSYAFLLFRKLYLTDFQPRFMIRISSLLRFKTEQHSDPSHGVI
jgi:hypothetical protein